MTFTLCSEKSLTRDLFECPDDVALVEAFEGKIYLMTLQKPSGLLRFSARFLLNLLFAYVSKLLQWLRSVL